MGYMLLDSTVGKSNGHRSGGENSAGAFWPPVNDNQFPTRLEPYTRRGIALNVMTTFEANSAPRSYVSQVQESEPVPTERQKEALDPE